MFKETVKMFGNLEILLTNENNNVKIHKIIPNLVVLTGKQFVSQRMISNTTSVMSHIAIGEGLVEPSLNDIALGDELIRQSITSVTVTSNTVTYVSSFLPGVGIGAITEAGIFNSSLANSGTMLCRTTFAVVNKEVGDTLTITWNVSPS